MDQDFGDINNLSADRLALLELLLREEGIDLGRWMIRPQPRNTPFFPLSLAQQRLWFLDQLLPGNPAYNELVVVRMHGQLDVPTFERCLHEVLRRHEVLRTTFQLHNEQPVQRIHPTGSLALNLIDLTTLDPAAREEEVQRIATAEAQQSFDLTRGPLLRVTLLKLAGDQQVLLLTVHHIIADGWSMGIFVRELSVLYTAFLHGRPSPLPALRIQYADFSCWQRQWLNEERLAPLLAYWRRQLAGPLPTLKLPSDYPRPPSQTFRGAHVPVTLPSTLTSGLKQVCQQQGVTLFEALMTGFVALLYAYSGQTDSLVGTDVAQRDHADIEGLIGFFVNQLVLRINLAHNPTLNELLAQVHNVALDAYAHQALPFDRLVDALQIERSLERTPLFQAKFVLQNPPLTAMKLDGVTLSLMEVQRGTAKFDLLLNMWEQDGLLFGLLDYSTDLFTRTTIERMVRCFEALLNVMVKQPTMQLETLCAMVMELDQSQRMERKQSRKAVNAQNLEKFARRSSPSPLGSGT